MLLLQEFNFDIQHSLGTQHTVTDYLSRIENGDTATEGDDDFPDGGILHITTSDPMEDSSPKNEKWLVDMSRFLNTALPSPLMRMDEKKRLVVRCWNFCLIGEAR